MATFSFKKLDRVFIVAEVSANHKQDYETAAETIRKIADCGADAVKMQTYTADTLTLDCDNEYFRIGDGMLWEGQSG